MPEPVDIKTILVTGGAGFIGSHLCDFLIAHNHRVIAMDNLLTGSMSNIDLALTLLCRLRGLPAPWKKRTGII